MHPPSANGPNGNSQVSTPFPLGRDGRGRFALGNPGGPGNPLAGRVTKMRRAFAEAVTDEDLSRIARALVDKAAGGDVAAARELLTRLVGDVAAAMLEERLALLEGALGVGARE